MSTSLFHCKFNKWNQILSLGATQNTFNNYILNYSILWLNNAKRRHAFAPTTKINSIRTSSQQPQQQIANPVLKCNSEQKNKKLQENRLFNLVKQQPDLLLRHYSKGVEYFTTSRRFYIASSYQNYNSKPTVAGVSPIIKANNLSLLIFNTRKISKMADHAENCSAANNDVFEGVPDRFNGITVDSATQFAANEKFLEKLNKSVNVWRENQKRAIWFKVRQQHAEWIPQLTKESFKFHHVRDDYVMLYRWLPENEYENLPVYAHTMVGVGGLVVNMDKREILVVNERFSAIAGSWKLPGGYVEPGENLIDAAIREVHEETNINSVFRTVVSIRHAHGGGYGCSDLYFVIALTPTTFEPKACEREIAHVQWLPFDEYLNHPHVHETNRHFLRTFLSYESRGIRFGCTKATHQILKKEYCAYDIQPLTDANDDCNKEQKKIVTKL